MTIIETTTTEVNREAARAIFRLAAVFQITTDEQALAMRDATGLARQLLKPEQPAARTAAGNEPRRPTSPT